MSIWAFPSIYPFDRPGLKWSGIFAHRQYKGLIENGADLKVVIPVPWHPPFPFSNMHPEWKQYANLNYPRKRVFDGITVYYPRISNMRPNRFVKKSFEERTIDTIINFFRDNGIKPDPNKDIIYSQWTPNSVTVQKAAHRLGLKSAILCIGDDVVLFPHEKPETKRQFIETWTQADYRFVVADYLGREANKVAGTSMPYEVVYMGVDHAYFKPGTAGEIQKTKQEYKIPTDKPVILIIGTASKRKGWIELFDALEEIKKKGTDFFLVGVHTGPLEFDLYGEVEKHGLSPMFLGLNGVPPDSLNRIYNVADIFCLPSHSEGMANVVIEAMSSGLPVITTDVGGHSEIVESGRNGVLIPQFDRKILAEKLQELLSGSGLRKELGANARDFIVNEWGNFAQASKKLYGRLSTLGSDKT